MNTLKKEGKGYFKLINLVTILLLSAILIPGSLAADPGHVASSIGSGMFESRRRAYHPMRYRQSDAE